MFPKIEERYLVYFVGVVIVMISIGFFDANNLDNFLYQYLRIGPLTYYDLPIWELFTAIGTISAVAVALYASHKSIKHVEKQLEIEQEPHVIAKDGVSIDGIDSSDARKPIGYLMLRLKNIGRGPALRVTVTGVTDDPNKSLFEDKKEPHSCDLGSGDEKNDWKIDEHQLKMLVQEKHKLEITKIDNAHPIYLYIFFKDQLGKPNKVRVKLLRSGSGDFLKVMENETL